MRLTPTLPLVSSETDASVAPSADTALRAKAEKAAEKFEGFFIGETLRQMRRSAREIAGEEGKERSNNDMLDISDTLLADTLAGRRAFGIADVILRQLLPTLPPASPVGETTETFKSGSPAVALDK